MKLISCEAGFVPMENIAFFQVHEDGVSVQLKSGQNFVFAKTEDLSQAIDIGERVANAVRKMEVERVHIQEDGTVTSWPDFG